MVICMRFLFFLPVVCLLSLAQLEAQSCPNIDPATGYPLAVTLPEGTPADSAWLQSAAHAAAYRWRVPSRQRNAYVGWGRVQRRLLPPEPRWADDWSPEPTHRAVLRVVMFRDGRKPRSEIIKPSGDKAFDQSLGSIADEPMPASPPLPAFPAGITADSMMLRVTLGELPDAAVRGLIRFAAVQTRIRLSPGSLRVQFNSLASDRIPKITVKYDVQADGSVDPRSIQFLQSGPDAMERAIREGLFGARFTAPTSNCRSIAQTVVQTFGG